MVTDYVENTGSKQKAVGPIFSPLRGSKFLKPSPLDLPKCEVQVATSFDSVSDDHSGYIKEHQNDDDNIDTIDINSPYLSMKNAAIDSDKKN